MCRIQYGIVWLWAALFLASVYFDVVRRSLGPVSICEKTSFRKISKSRDWYFKLLHHFEIWQAHRQPCCRSACQISERSDNFKYKSRGFETLRDLTERRLFGYWDVAQLSSVHHLIRRKRNTCPRHQDTMNLNVSPCGAATRIITG